VIQATQIFYKQPRNEEYMKSLDEALGYLNTYLAEGYVAGNHMTIADFSVIATVSSIEAVGHDLSKYPKIKTYLETCKAEMTDYEEANGKGAEQLGAAAKAVLGKPT